MAETAEGVRRRELVGVALVCGATLVWALTGFYTRALTTDMWTTLAGRSAFGLIILVALFLARHHRGGWRQFVSMGRWGVAHAAASVVCAVTTVTSLYNTTVANNTVIYATAPIVATGLAWAFLGERIDRRTIAAGLVSMIGVAICVSGSAGGIHLVGDLLAVAMTLSFSAMTVISRAHPTMPVLPPNILAVAVNLLVALPFADLRAVGPADAALLAAFGFTNFVLAGTLYLAGSARLPAARSSLIITLDIVFSPALVWVAFGEAPSLQAMIGGAVVFAAVVANIATTRGGGATRAR